jgi:hypothetical protein
MSNSFRHTPITGITCSESDKWYKKRHSRQERMKAKDLIKHGKYEIVDSEVIPYESWLTPKDGKQYLDYNPNNWPCFDEWFRELKRMMRK